MLPWKRKKKIHELEEEIEELEENIESLQEERESFRKRFEAEKERRSELSRKKQEAEKELKKLREKDEKEEVEEEKVEEKVSEAEDISVERTKKILEKLDSYKSPEKDLATVYSPGKLSSISDLKGLKNSISRQNYSFLEGEGFVGFVEPDLVRIKIKSRPFFPEDWSLGSDFQVSEIRDFIEEEKEWAVVSAGDSRIVREKSGEILEVEEINDRIEKKQKKGGFSQGRFERKREEQIEQHIKKVGEKASEDALLVGEERLCKKLPGEYLGGFDDSRKLVDSLYGFRLERNLSR